MNNMNKVNLVSIIVVVLIFSSYNFLIISELNQEEDKMEVFPNYYPGFQTGSIFSPQTLDSGGGASSSGEFTCVIYENGSLYCSGWNSAGQLGLGYVNFNPSHPSEVGNDQPKFVNLGENNTAISVHLGVGHHACAILMNMELRCWGANYWGQVGAGFRSNTTFHHSLPSPQVVDLGANRTAVTVAIAGQSTCAILDNGLVKCWGYNVNGELGRGFQSDYEATPGLVNLGEGNTAKSITAGLNFFCAILNDNSLKCWGESYQNQLAYNNPSAQANPINITYNHGLKFVAVSAGQTHVCAIHLSGALYCWGTMYSGTSFFYNQSDYVPQQQYLGDGRTAIAVDSGSFHTCVILNDDATSNRVFCFGGENYHYELGHYSSVTIPAPNSFTRIIRFISNGTPSQDGYAHGGDAVGIVAGGSTSCFILENLSMYCWGKLQGGIAMSTNSEWRYGYPVDSNLPSGVYLPDRDFDNDSIINIFDTNFVGDADGDGVPNSIDSHPYNPVFGVYCGIGEYGRYTCLNSEPGYYVPSQGYVYQIPCTPGSYNPHPGSINIFSCLDSSIGHYVDTFAAISETPCPIGTYNNNIGADSASFCIDSSPGHYVNTLEGAGYQIECFYGKYQPLSGTTYCIDSEPGHFVNTTASISQQACEIGYYQPMSGQSNCINSEPGYFVDTTSATMQNQCLIGTYQPNFSASNCLSASIGYYVDIDVSISQTHCPPYSSTLETGSTSISQCEIDTDADYIPNSIDDDDDGDGYLDNVDYFPLDIFEWIDTDFDGIGNNDDEDDDNDGWSDYEEISCYSDPLRELILPNDIDNDGYCDDLDPDSDGDSVLNYDDAFPLNANEWEDSDFDGIGDNQDLDDDNDNWLDINEINCGSNSKDFLSTPYDYDSDMICNLMDNDDDNDGFEDLIDSFPLNTFEWFDNDLDGIGDNEDNDDDNDGFEDLIDSFPLDSSEWSDRDFDGIGDFSDLDNDNDGWSDSDEYNCSTDPLLQNSFPKDDDNDGICNSLESQDFFTNQTLFYLIISLIALVIISIIMMLNINRKVLINKRNKSKIKNRSGLSKTPSKKVKKKSGPSKTPSKKVKKKSGPSKTPSKKGKKKSGPSKTPSKKVKKNNHED